MLKRKIVVHCEYSSTFTELVKDHYTCLNLKVIHIHLDSIDSLSTTEDDPHNLFLICCMQLRTLLLPINVVAISLVTTAITYIPSYSALYFFHHLWIHSLLKVEGSIGLSSLLRHLVTHVYPKNRFDFLVVEYSRSPWISWLLSSTIVAASFMLVTLERSQRLNE